MPQICDRCGCEYSGPGTRVGHGERLCGECTEPRTCECGHAHSNGPGVLCNECMWNADPTWGPPWPDDPTWGPDDPRLASPIRGGRQCPRDLHLVAPDPVPARVATPPAGDDGDFGWTLGPRRADLPQAVDGAAGVLEVDHYCDTCGRKRKSDDEPWFYESYTTFETGYLPLEHCGRCWQEKEEEAARTREFYSRLGQGPIRGPAFDDARLSDPPPAPRRPKPALVVRRPEAALVVDPPGARGWDLVLVALAIVTLSMVLRAC